MNAECNYTNGFYQIPLYPLLLQEAQRINSSVLPTFPTNTFLPKHSSWDFFLLGSGGESVLF